MGEAAKRIATYNDLLAVPPHLVAEIVDGELYTQARPALPHTDTQTGLLAWARWQFHRGRGGSGGWWIENEPEIHFSNDVCVPDIAGWRKERMPRLSRAAFFTLVPDWICEVLSPSTVGFDRVKKMAVYARNGVEYAWLVEPLERILEAYRLVNGCWMRVAAHTDNECVRVPPFDEIELNLAELWAELE